MQRSIAARMAALGLALAGCSNESFSGSENAPVDGSTSDGSSSDATLADGGAGDATSPDAAGPNDASGPQYRVHCGANDCTDQSCCFEFDGGTTATCQSTSATCNPPKARFLCDDGDDCTAQGHPGYQCCAADSADNLLGSQCEVKCSNTEWRLCNPQASKNECAGDTLQGQNCRLLANRPPAGFSACQQ